MIIPIPPNLKKPVWIVLIIVAAVGLTIDYSEHLDIGRLIYFIIIWLIFTHYSFMARKRFSRFKNLIETTQFIRNMNIMIENTNSRDI